MNKKIRIVAIVGAIIVSIVIISSPSDPILIPTPSTNSTTTKSTELVAENLKKPWAMDFADDRIFLTEKVGTIRIVQAGKLLDQPLATFRVADVIDGGLLGLALHPDFEQNHFLYVYYTYEEGGTLWNKVIRITEYQNKLQETVTIIDKIPGAEFDNGGIIKFGPDRKLYIGTGDATNENSAQDMESLSGKILRLNDDGSTPSDNPFKNSIFSYGHRNPQGMAWDKLGKMFMTEEGPTKNDEINQVITGKNFGWPKEECGDDKRFVSPLACFNPSLEPAGIVFYSSDKLDLANSLILATLRGTNLYSISFENGHITSQQSILGGVGRIRDVNVGHDGYLYILTGNTDGRGFPDKTDDKLIRIVR